MDKVTARHILVTHEYEAQDLLKKMELGESFDQLASSFSKCPSGKQGGLLGTFGRGRMVEAFEEAAFALNVGEISSPVRTQFGYHIIQRVED